MIEFWGLKIHLYGLLVGLGAWLALEIALWRQKNLKIKKQIEGAFWWVVLGGVVGARIYHVIDFWTRYYALQPIKVIYFWEGGLGIWGAICGAIGSIYLYSRVKKISFITLLDNLIVGAPLAQAIGRIGNRVNGELFGKNGEPLFAYEAVLNLILFGFLWKWSRKQSKPGVLTGIYLTGYGVIRVLLEGLRPQEIIWRVAGIPVAIIFGVVSVIIGTWIASVRLRNSQ